MPTFTTTPSSSGLNEAAVFAQAREITGNQISQIAGATHASDEAIRAALKPAIRELNKHFGTSTGQKEITFQTVAGQQLYSITENIGADVYRITELVRSGERIPAGILHEAEVSPVTGLPTVSRMELDWAMTPHIPSVILGQDLARRSGEYDWETVGGESLRLMPVPGGVETVWVRYVTNGFSIETLPEEAESCLVWAACVAIMDAEINRNLGQKWQQHQDAMTGATVGDPRVRLLKDQRDYYERKYEQEFRRLVS